MRCSAVLTGAACLIVIPAAAHAAGNGSLDGMLQQFTQGADAIEGITTTAGERLFGFLAIIELIFALWSPVLSGNFSDIASAIVKQFVVIGFFWWILTNGADFSNAIIQSFAILGGQAAMAAGGVNVMSPTDVFNAGVNIAHAIWQGMTWNHPLLGILLVLSGIIDLLVFAKVAGMMIEVIVESAIVTYAGLVLLGFGGTVFTRSYAVSFFRFCVSVGFKRMMLQILVGIGTGWITQVSNTLQAGIEPTWTTIAYLVALPLVMLQLVEKLPYRSQDLINGAASHGGSTMFSTAMVVGAAAGAGTASLSGAGAAGMAAVRAAAQEVGSSGSSSGALGRVAQAARIGASAAGSIGSAAAEDVGKRLTGSAARGFAGWRMAQSIRNNSGGTP